MALPWTSARDALTSALASAPSADRAEARAALDALNALGARYDAAIASGALATVAGATLDAVRAGRVAEARAGLDRATTYLRLAMARRDVDAGLPDDVRAARIAATVASLRALDAPALLADAQGRTDDPAVQFAAVRVAANLATLGALTAAVGAGPLSGALALEQELAAAMTLAARWTEYLE